MPNRRTFLAQGGAALTGALLLPALPGCAPTNPLAHIKGQMVGQDAATGHLLRDPTRIPPPTETLETEVLIIGGGVAGLSARRWLHRHGLRDTLLVEMAAETGGNAAAGQNAASAYPWGAHYLPVPDVRNVELLGFLQECGALTGYAPNGLPIYSDYHLCHDPDERLSIDGHWQDGLVPNLNLSAAEEAQFARFFKLIDNLKAAKGRDGRDAFCIPLDHASADPEYRQLDQLSFADYLTREGFTAAPLRWYLDYACRDDYGALAAQVSAWAGLHYFASRKGRAYNATGSDVLTWPEGNQFLTENLRRQAAGPIQSRTLAYDLRETASGVEVLTYNAATRLSSRVRARRVLLATPLHIAHRLLAQVPGHALPPHNALHHAPWLIANLTVEGLPQGPGRPLSWDNVRYGSASLGYINAAQQSLQQENGAPKVITLYWPLTDEAPGPARRRAYQTPYAEWLPRVVAELETYHPGVTPYIQQADLWVWGHGMVAPTPGLVWGAARQAAMQPVRDRIFFAHTDLSGISIFEEGFYQGIRAAREMLGVFQADNPLST
ncbi:NAD(P)-binding protein [Hymenobacter properus]|uniref:NAD(P)-binding protein n=1 Tax=Hymenobacter properus TaxID=2791026 RepID=A0A931BIN7_9BACT|nr:NAD(P)-binding protein [Hymenobacter properus]MBF9140185.1 NAD(P)-binding protein [Hymenobacter properus]MBR7718992.1 NAD(P)-binding protein [Microvirga sp. SRT04]